MRIRLPFAITFFLILLIASSYGLLPHGKLPSAPEAVQKYVPPQFDKVLHFITFFALSLVFYFILDTSRRRILHLSLIFCTLILGVGSEVVQGLLDNGRDFDPLDVVANVVGSLCAIGMANLYHRRSLERRRRAKYSAVPGGGIEDDDLELGEGLTTRRDDDGQESGIVSTPPLPRPHRSVEEELDRWDENAPDDEWDDEDDNTTAQMKLASATGTASSEGAQNKMAVD